MVRECRPPAREPARSWLARRSTMATSTPANANSPANISPVGPPPAITTACSVIATLRPASRRSRPYRPDGLGQVEVQGVQEIHCRVARVDRHVAGDVEQRLGVVEDDAHAGGDEIVGRRLRAL